MNAKVISILVLVTTLVLTGCNTLAVAEPTITQTFTPPPTHTPKPSLTPTATLTITLQDIEKMISLGDEIPSSLVSSVREGIQADPSTVVEALLPKLSDPEQTEQALATYAWALGIAKDPITADALIKLASETESKWVKINCLVALGAIGDQKSGEGLVSILGEMPEDDRFLILNELAEIKYEPALPLMLELLDNPDDDYWQRYLVFGKMGETAVPFLIAKIDDENPDVRINTIELLSWLNVPEAAQILLDHYWTEESPVARELILITITGTVSDLSQVKTIFEKIVAQETMQEPFEYAQETLDLLPSLQSERDLYLSAKNISAVDFQQAYATLFETAGLRGDFELLERSSSLQDEGALIKLRERILLRNSDECFEDFMTVSRIIMMNRFVLTE